MNDAIEIFFTIWTTLLDFLFNRMVIIPGVTVGYVLAGLIIIIIVINIAVSRPKKGNSDE